MTPNRNNAIEPYALLRAALELFKKPPAELEALQLRQAEIQARNEYALEARVLNSPEAAGVIIPARELQHAFDEVRRRFDDEREFAAALKNNALTVESLKNALFRQCMVSAVMERVAARAPQVSEVEIGIYYHAHPEKFHSPEQRIARHILISINPDYPENSCDNAWQRMQTIAATLKRKPNKFADLALKNSECPTALNGGELGVITPGKLYPQLDAALFKLKEHEISEVVETEIGFHLIQCVKIMPGEIVSLKKAAPKIRQLLQQRCQRICQRSWLASLPAVK